MCPLGCGARAPEEKKGPCPMGNEDPRMCHGDPACDNLAEKAMIAAGQTNPAGEALVLESEPPRLTPGEEHELDLYREEGASHD